MSRNQEAESVPAQNSQKAKIKRTFHNVLLLLIVLGIILMINTRMSPSLQILQNLGGIIPSMLYRDAQGNFYFSYSSFPANSSLLRIPKTGATQEEVAQSQQISPMTVGANGTIYGTRYYTPNANTSENRPTEILKCRDGVLKCICKFPDDRSIECLVRGKDARLYGISSRLSHDGNLNIYFLFCVNTDGSEYTVIRQTIHSALSFQLPYLFSTASGDTAGAIPAGHHIVVFTLSSKTRMQVVHKFPEVVFEYTGTSGSLTLLGLSPENILYGYSTVMSASRTLEDRFFYARLSRVKNPVIVYHPLSKSFAASSNVYTAAYLPEICSLCFGKQGKVYGILPDFAYTAGGNSSAVMPARIIEMNADTSHQKVLYTFSGGKSSSAFGWITNKIDRLLHSSVAAGSPRFITMGRDENLYGVEVTGNFAGYGTGVNATKFFRIGLPH